MKNIPSYSELLLFKYIYEEKNLGFAATKMQISVSNASHILKKLRAFFDHELFMKSKDGLVITAKAIALYPSVCRALEATQDLIEPEPLDLKSVRQVVRIGCVDNAPFMLFPRLVEMIYEAAPNITLVFLPLTKNRLERLRQNDFQFIISPVENIVDHEYYRVDLGVSRYVLFGHPNHPLQRLASLQTEGVHDEQIKPYSFIDILFQYKPNSQITLRSLVFPGWTDFKTALQTYYFIPFTHSLAHTDLLMVLPERTAKMLAQRGIGRIIPTVTRSVVNTPQLIWHRNTHKDPLLQWLRGMLLLSVQNAKDFEFDMV